MKAPEITGSNHRSATAYQPKRLLCWGGAIVFEQQPGKYAEQAGSNCRQRAEQALRIAGCVPQSPRQIICIDPIGEICIGIERPGTHAGYRYERHESPVAAK